jgi:hypothetical protein
MLLDKEIETGLNGGMAKYYESLGYDIPRRMTKQYKMQVPLHAKIKVKISDLPKNSMLKVRVECDCCKKEMKMAYQSYCCYKHEDDTYYCNKCKAKLFNSGKNSSNWNPNITDEERELKRNTLEYTKWVKTVLARDNYICQCCGKPSNADVEAHHLDGWNWCREKRYDETNGITLCETCHKNFHLQYGKGDNTKEQFEEWIGHAVEIVKYEGELPTTKKIYCIEEDKIYNSAKDVSIILNCNLYNVYAVCNHSSNSVNGYHLIYLDEYENMSKEELGQYFENCCRGKIVCLYDNKVFNSPKEASIYYDCDASSISNCCNGRITGVYINNRTQKVQFMHLNDYNNGNKLNDIIDYSVICLYNNKIFNSVNEASEYYNCINHSLSRVCKGINNYIIITIPKTKEKIKTQFMFLKDYNNGKQLKPIDYEKYNTKVICVTYNKKFSSIKEAGEYYNCNVTSISRCCRRINNYVKVKNPDTSKIEKVQFMYLEDWNNGDEPNKIKEYGLICEYDNKFFKNPKEASIYYNCHINSIRNNCNGRSKSVLITTKNGEQIKTTFKKISNE